MRVPASLTTLDRWTLVYAVVATSALALHWPVKIPMAGLLPLSHLLIFALIASVPRARRSGAMGRFFGEWYPLLLVSAFYSEIGVLNRGAGRSYDVLVQQWEQALFGMQPSVEWIRVQPWPWLSVPLHVGYLSYYFIVACAPLALWITGRRQAARLTLLYSLATFYVCFTFFLIFPVAGPRYLFPLPHNAATAVAPAVFTQRLLDTGASWGTAFPSSHVAVTLVASVMAWRGWRMLGWIFIPLAALLTLGTVYGQLHYATDALAGSLLAGVVLWIARRPPKAYGIRVG
ncbi:MAG: phosphatase PAP2 family protein [Vicinamibacteria bacterium]|nr:phosphatase PAP2 family protein [Vicinamibacteria bacterium]